MKKNLATIVIPVYKTKLTKGEKKSLRRCVKILGDYPIVFVHPEFLDTSEISFNGLIKSEAFDEKYFDGILGYNELMLTSDFYARFLDSTYILIYQLDAYVFRDELADWCLKGYDYIGAPWIASKNTNIKKFLKLFHSNHKRKRAVVFHKVGNGGFSLRKVESCLRVTTEFKDDIQEHLQLDCKDFRLMEDVYWSLRVPSIFPEFNIPEYQEAVGFAIDRKPKLAMKLNDNNLPFGCHGFEKPKVKEFWNEIID